MKGKFENKKKKRTATISTASLPDIVFMLLFFFMVATVLRKEDPLVRTLVPAATELTQLAKKNFVSTINIGAPMPNYQEKYGTAPRIQLNDQFAEPQDIIEFVENERLQREERMRPYMTFALKVDKNAKMGLVTDVKQELRKAGALKITYSARKRADKD